ncbi:MAG TPA: GNAT family N-acetyltransferase [Actinomycetota bacterium]|nr:GNAT family N-acetyltransferase [Actinomycetota bacterium]
MSDQSPENQSANWEERSLTTPGGRLRMEPLTREHAVEMAEVLKDPSLNEHIGGQPPSVEYLATRYETLSSRRSPGSDELWLNWIVRLNAHGLAVGYVQATVRENSAALAAWVIGVPWQRTGIATEATAAMIDLLRDELALTTFSASIAPANPASQRVAAKLGMHRSGMMADGEDVWVVSASTPESSTPEVSTDGGRAR